MTDAGAFEERVRLLLRVVAGREDYETATRLLADDVIAFIDGRRLSGTQGAWLDWVRYLHHRAAGRIAELDINVDAISSAPAPAAVSESAGRRLQRVVVTASWHGKDQRTGEPLAAALGEIAYDLDEARIRAIYTHKHNYTFIYGDAVRYAPVFYFWVARMMLWRALGSARL